MSPGLYHFVPKTCWASGVRLSQAIGPLLSTAEVASCGCAVTTGLVGSVVLSHASLYVGSFWFRSCICGQKYDILINTSRVSVFLLVGGIAGEGAPDTPTCEAGTHSYRKGRFGKWQGTVDGGRISISQPKKKKRKKRLQRHKGLESGGGECCLLLLCCTSSPPWFPLPSPLCADATSGAGAAASLGGLGSSKCATGLCRACASAAAAGTAALNAWGDRVDVAATKCHL
jgi:hypothetical protein